MKANMKNVLLMIFAILILSCTVEECQTKVACIKGYEWRNRRCRKKKKNNNQNEVKSDFSDKINNHSMIKYNPLLSDTELEDKISNDATEKNTSKENYSSDSIKTEVPLTFIPIMKQIDGNTAGLLGNYFKNSGIGIISDPFGENTKRYTFKNVQVIGIDEPKDNLIEGNELIGSMSNTPSYVYGTSDFDSTKYDNYYPHVTTTMLHISEKYRNILSGPQSSNKDSMQNLANDIVLKIDQSLEQKDTDLDITQYIIIFQKLAAEEYGKRYFRADYKSYAIQIILDHLLGALKKFDKK